MPLPPNYWLYGNIGMKFGLLFQSVMKLTALWEPHTCLTLVTVTCLGFASRVWPLSIPVEQVEERDRAFPGDSSNGGRVGNQAKWGGQGIWALRRKVGKWTLCSLSRCLAEQLYGRKFLIAHLMSTKQCASLRATGRIEVAGLSSLDRSGNALKRKHFSSKI